MSNSATPEPPGTTRTLRSSRNPRRRPRVETDSVKVAPRRKRSKLSEDTFLPRDGHEEVNGEESAINGQAAHVASKGPASRKISEHLTPNALELPVRGPKGSIKRTARTDGGMVLTKNEDYAVKMLPSSPKELKREANEFRGSICAATNQALAVTREKAFVWDYTAHTTTGNIKVLDVPFATRSSEPLPFGALVTDENAVDTGLLLVSATSGKVVFHESIERVSSMGLFHERKDGVSGTIGGLFSGETVVDIVSAHSAGFILLLSSGRVVHFALRDTQGKLKLQSQLLYATENAAGGIFGSIKGLLGGASWRSSASAVRTRPLARGQTQVVASTEKGELRIWDLNWSGRYDYRASIDFREELSNELKQVQSAELQGSVANLAVLDFAITDRSDETNGFEIATIGSDRPLDLLLLVRTGSPNMQSHFLVEISLLGSDFQVRRILQTRTYQPQGDATDIKPHLLIPQPGHTAFVVFPDAIVLVSLSGVASNPEAQLHEASYIDPESFEDVIYLRRDKPLAFVGGEIVEDKGSKDASCIAFVIGAGLLRITAFNTSHEQGRSSVPVKSKIEQAIFYGTLEGNILDLTHQRPQQYNQEDVEEAALAISGEILRSESPFIQMPPPVIEANLAKRLQALFDLAGHLKQAYPPLSRKSMWLLLFDAEKVAAGKALWPTFEDHIVNASQKKRESTLLHEISECMQAAQPFDILWDKGGSDELVQTIFVTQLGRIEKLLPWARQVLKDTIDERRHSSGTMLRLISEADDIWLHCLETVFQFRTTNADIYGIPRTALKDGIVTDIAECQHVPEFWTSTTTMLKEIGLMSDLSRHSAEAVYENDTASSTSGYIEKIAEESPRLVQLCCSIFQERITWALSRGSAKYHDQGRKLELAFKKSRYKQIRALAEVGQLDAGLALAEKYHDMRTLTEMLIGESQYLVDNRETLTPKGRMAIDEQLEKIDKRVHRSFAVFGDDFADAFFGEGFSGGKPGTMLMESQTKWNKPLTQWLRKDQSRWKLGWINELTHNKDFEQAHIALSHGANVETEVWRKGVELSLAKLTILSLHDPEPALKLDQANLKIYNNGLKKVETQQRLFRYILPEIRQCIDYEAEVEVATERFGAPYLARCVALQSRFRQAISKLVAHETLEVEELIDALSLMQSVANVDDQTNMFGREPFEALLALGLLPEQTDEYIDVWRRLIWKRAFLRDNWQVINAGAAKKSATEVRHLLTQTCTYRTVLLALDKKLASPSQDSLIQTPSPSEVIGAGREVGSWANALPEEIREAVAGDHKEMDSALETEEKEYHLESWWTKIVKCATEEIDMVSESEAEKLAWARELQEKLEFANRPRANGHANGIKVEDADEGHDALYQEESDADVDVDMDMDESVES